MQDKKILIEKIREWDSIFEGKRTRNNFLKSDYGKYFNRKHDIDKDGWPNLYQI